MNTCPYCGGNDYRTNLREGRECSNCGAPWGVADPTRAGHKFINAEMANAAQGYYTTVNSLIHDLSDWSDILNLSAISVEDVGRALREARA